MNHQPFEEWLLNDSPIDLHQTRELEVHLRSCAYCSALAKTEKVMRSVNMAMPLDGFGIRFQARLAAYKEAEAKNRIRGLVLFAALGLGLMTWLALPYISVFFATPASWIILLVEWGVFLVTTLEASAQAGVVLLNVLRDWLPPFAWMVILSAFAGMSLLWSVSIWRFVRVPQGV